MRVVAPKTQIYAVRALGIIGRYTPLPLPEGSAEGQSATGEGDATAPKVLTKGDLVKKLTTLLGSTTEAKLIEKLALALGYMCVGEPGIAHKVPISPSPLAGARPTPQDSRPPQIPPDTQTDILNALYGLDKTKSEEIHFSVGEALSCVASGAASAAAKDPLHPEIDDPLDDDDDHHDVSKKREAEKKAQQQQQQKDAEGDDKGKQKQKADVPAPVEVPYPEVMAGMLTKLFSLVQSGANLSRNAAAIWLLSLLQHSSTHPELRSKLALIQAYFSRLLAGNPPSPGLNAQCSVECLLCAQVRLDDDADGGDGDAQLNQPINDRQQRGDAGGGVQGPGHGLRAGRRRDEAGAGRQPRGDPRHRQGQAGRRSPAQG